MSKLRAALLNQLVRLPLAGQTLTLALSGGRDSVALLVLLLGVQQELGFKLHALHVNHHLSPHADQWQAFCEQFCQSRSVPLRVEHLDLQRQGGESLEALAREGRYRAFLQAQGSYVVLAHHADDQAETFLLQALRGAGPNGLSAMPLQRDHGEKILLRPLLGSRRVDIDGWLAAQGLDWVEDESNADARYRRNALRRLIMPELERIQPGAATALGRAASYCAETSELMRELALIDGNPQTDSLDVAELSPLSPARARNLLRVWLMLQGVRMPSALALEEFLQQILSAGTDRQPLLPLDDGSIQRFQGRLYRVPAWSPVPVSLVWKGEHQVRVPGWSGCLSLVEADQGLDPVRLYDCTIDFCTRQGGERIKLAANRPSQSVKKLFQQSAIPPWERQRWPLLQVRSELVAIPGLGVSLDWQKQPGLMVHWQAD